MRIIHSIEGNRNEYTRFKHINNALKEELSGQNTVVEKFATTASDGKNLCEVIRVMKRAENRLDTK